MPAFSKSKIYDITFKAICFIGCYCQIHDILSNYLSYKTMTRVKFRFPEFLVAPDVSYCIRFSDIFDYKKYERLHNVKLSRRTGDETFNVLKILESVLVKDIYDSTPDSSDIMKECWMRPIDGLKLTHFVQNECYNLIRISKYLVNEFICYRFRINAYENVTLSMKLLNLSPTYLEQLFAIGFHIKPLETGNRIRLTAHNKNLPRLSSASSDITYRRVSEGKYDGYYVLMYNEYTVNLLPSPYQTNCLFYREIGFHDREECFSACFERSMINSHKLVPSSIITETRYDHLFWNPINSKFKKEIVNLEANCKEKCKKASCIINRSMTSTYIRDDEHIIVVRSPKIPYSIVTHHPNIQLSELIIFVMSCLGSWFGFSWLGLISSRKKRK